MEHVVNHLRKKNRSFQRNVSDVHIIKGNPMHQMNAPVGVGYVYAVKR